MPANVIELTQKYIPQLDYQYQVEAKSSLLDADPALIQETRSAKTIRIPKMHLTGLRNYNRNEGFKFGVQTLEWQEHTFTQDRSSRFTVDIMDDIETLGVAYGKLSAEFQRLHVIPELDAYRFATYAELAGTQDDSALTKANIYSKLSDAQSYLDEEEVPGEGRLLYVSNATYNLMKQSTEVQKKWSVEQRQDPMGIDFNVEYFDTIRIERVPQKRFLSAIDILDTEDGGYAPKADARNIDFLFIHPTATMQIKKRAITRIFAPSPELAAQTGAWGVTQNMDAWDIQDRLYHDAFVLDNKKVGIFVNTSARTEG